MEESVVAVHEYVYKSEVCLLDPDLLTYAE